MRDIRELILARLKQWEEDIEDSVTSWGGFTSDPAEKVVDELLTLIPTTPGKLVCYTSEGAIEPALNEGNERWNDPTVPVDRKPLWRDSVAVFIAPVENT